MCQFSNLFWPSISWVKEMTYGEYLHPDICTSHNLISFLKINSELNGILMWTFFYELGRLTWICLSITAGQWINYLYRLFSTAKCSLPQPTHKYKSIHPSTYSTTPRHPLETAFFELPFSYCQVSIEASIWLGQSSQIWKDLFLLNLKNSTIPKVFISEIVNFPSFRIQTFHISCTPPRFTPALSRTLFTLNHHHQPPKWSSEWNILYAKYFPMFFFLGRKN